MNALPKNFVTTIDLSLGDKLMNDLAEQGFDISTPPYTLFSAKKSGLTCTLYTSGKLVVQGKETPSFLEFYLEPEILKATPYTYQDLELNIEPHIGIDESGKGDFFGPLCIAGVYAEGESIKGLKTLGVKDSKALSDATILKIGKRIRVEYTHHVVKINPAKYNELYAQFHNLNRLLAWGHATTIEQLVTKSGCKQVIIDQFAAEEVVLTALKRKSLEVFLTQRHRGEEDLVVAAASILARQAFLEGLEELGREFSITLPKGASAATIRTGKALVEKFGADVLKRTAKMHFKTLDAIL